MILIFKRFYDEAKLHCKNKFFLWRAVVFLFCVYVFVRSIFDKDYSSIVSALNLGIHEMGHFGFLFLGQFLHVAGGTISQLGVPIASIFMFYKQKDFFAIGFGLFWLATNIFYVAWYIGSVGDDTYNLAVPFAAFGNSNTEPIHDWVYLLNSVGLINYYAPISFLVYLLAIVVMVAGIYWMFLMLKLIKNSSKIRGWFSRF